MRKYVLMLFAISFLLSNVSAASGIDSKNSSIVPMLPIKCSGTIYTHAGMYMSKKGNDFHEIDILKETNSTPLENVVLQKDNEILMVDNVQFRIVNTDKNDLMAVYLDERNIITVVINHKYGTLLYNKTFTNSLFGKQNSMSYIASCSNY
ncbi:MAG: hypothetical protein AABZ21_05065 [Deltaproteobacteria bacterium]